MAAERPTRQAARILYMIGTILRGSLALFLPLALPVGASSTSPEILEATNRTCVPAGDMAVAGIELGAAVALVESRLGTAIRQESQGSTRVLEYEGLRIRLHASRVQSVLAKTPNWSTPSGIHPGLSADQAGAILGFDLDSIESPHSKSARHYQIHRCIGANEQIDVEQFLRLDLSADRVIAAVEIFWLAP